MKILLRNWCEERYVWKTAKYNGNKFVIDGIEVDYTNIVSVANDNRKGYATCSACGQFLKNTPKVIEEHKHKFEQPDACFTCRHMRMMDKTLTSTKFVKKKDGTCLKKTEEKVVLGCRYGRYYGAINVNSEEAKANCALRACANAEFHPFKDIFLEYPGVFDNIAMVDQILDVGYKHRGDAGNYTIYRLKGRNQICAYVNELGIIEYFVVSYHDDEFKLFYSKKYDMLFVDDCRRYNKFNDWYSVPVKTKEYIKRKIAELYI